MEENNPYSKPYNFPLSLQYHLFINKIHEKQKSFKAIFIITGRVTSEQ